MTSAPFSALPQVLNELHDSNWGSLWDLGPHSTFLDIGSGYVEVAGYL